MGTPLLDNTHVPEGDVWTLNWGEPSFALVSFCILIPNWDLFDKEVRSGAPLLLIRGGVRQKSQIVETSGFDGRVCLFLFRHMCGVSRCYFIMLRGEETQILAISAVV